MGIFAATKLNLARHPRTVQTPGGQIEWVERNKVRITDIGYSLTKVEQGHEQLLKEFQDLIILKKSTSIGRGLLLEKLIERAQIPSDWHFERNPVSAIKENGLVLYQGMNRFVFGCKCENKPVRKAVVRCFAGWVNYHSPSRGVLVSPSGFSLDAIAEVEEKAEGSMILLFGPKDIERALFGHLAPLINEKLELAITNRKFEFK